MKKKKKKDFIYEKILNYSKKEIDSSKLNCDAKNFIIKENNIFSQKNINENLNKKFSIEETDFLLDYDIFEYMKLINFFYFDYQNIKKIEHYIFQVLSLFLLKIKNSSKVNFEEKLKIIKAYQNKKSKSKYKNKIKNFLEEIIINLEKEKIDKEFFIKRKNFEKELKKLLKLSQKNLLKKFLVQNNKLIHRDKILDTEKLQKKKLELILSSNKFLKIKEKKNFSNLEDNSSIYDPLQKMEKTLNLEKTYFNEEILKLEKRENFDVIEKKNSKKIKSNILCKNSLDNVYEKYFPFEKNDVSNFFQNFYFLINKKYLFFNSIKIILNDNFFKINLKKKNFIINLDEKQIFSNFEKKISNILEKKNI